MATMLRECSEHVLSIETTIDAYVWCENSKTQTPHIVYVCIYTFVMSIFGENFPQHPILATTATQAGIEDLLITREQEKAVVPEFSMT